MKRGGGRLLVGFDILILQLAIISVAIIVRPYPLTNCPQSQQKSMSIDECVCVCVRQVMVIYGRCYQLSTVNWRLAIPVALSSSRNMCGLSNNFQLSVQSR